jgi:hypothetical protein
MPSDLLSHIQHTTPKVNFNTVQGAPSLNLNNLDALNGMGGTSVYLTSNDDVTTGPKWLNGVVPDGKGRTNGAISAAIIVNDKGSGVVDAFYMYFYSYNWGGIVDIFDIDIGNYGQWRRRGLVFLSLIGYR